MKIQGKKASKEGAIYGPIIVDRFGEELPIYAQPVWSMDEFNKRLPFDDNQVEFVFTPNGKQYNQEAKRTKDYVAERDRARWGYVALKSLEPSKIDFDDEDDPEEFRVSIEKPETWTNVEAAIDHNFGHYEAGRIKELIDKANMIDSDKVELRGLAFLARQAQSEAEGRDTQSGGAQKPNSGTPASESGSSLGTGKHGRIST